MNGLHAVAQGLGAAAEAAPKVAAADIQAQGQGIEQQNLGGEPTIATYNGPSVSITSSQQPDIEQATTDLVGSLLDDGVRLALGR